MAYGVVPLAGAISSIPRSTSEQFRAGAAIDPHDLEAFAAALSLATSPSLKPGAREVGREQSRRRIGFHFVTTWSRSIHCSMSSVSTPIAEPTSHSPRPWIVDGKNRQRVSTITRIAQSTIFCRRALVDGRHDRELRGALPRMRLSTDRDDRGLRGADADVDATDATDTTVVPTSCNASSPQRGSQPAKRLLRDRS